ncbi:MAG: radical SAM protein [bacterium]
MRRNLFRERLSPFLREKLNLLLQEQGEFSSAYRGLAIQYLWHPREDVETPEVNIRHYDADIASDVQGADHASGMERLYRRTLVIEPTMACLANCRFCLRSNYPRHTLTENELVAIAKYCGNEQNRGILNEVLITGGDPLTIPHRVGVLLEALIEYAPNIRIIRLATRIPTQDPERIDDDVLALFKNKPTLRFELATQINHPIELSFEESQQAFQRILKSGTRVYSQNVLLKGVNDDIDTLVDLYDAMRENNIEAHYLFHAIPMQGTHHLRCSLDKGLCLARQLTSCGKISGRSKPMFAAMTEIGKITLYEGTIMCREKGRLLLNSNYKLSDRLAWNPSFRLPNSAVVSESGHLQIWYLDGNDCC